MRSKPDEAHVRTDKELAALEARIAAEYKRAGGELRGGIEAYFESFARRDAETRARIGSTVNGREYTERDYTQWRLARIGRGKGFEALRDRVAARMTEANETAAALINDTTPGLYSLNRNYAAYAIEQQVGRDAGLDLWDGQRVKRLAAERPELMPHYPAGRAVERERDLAWGRRQVTAQVTQGILQGESVKRLSARLQSRIPDMNRTGAVRAARAAVTGAENAGRLDGYIDAGRTGMELERQWVAILDNRTRPTHAAADGQVVGLEEPFIVGGCALMFPGDPSGPPREILNCRCTQTVRVKGADPPDATRQARDPVTGELEVIDYMTYQEWYDMKEAQYGKEAMELSWKKAANEASDRKQFEEYREVLGKDAPESLEKFQDLKYSDSEQWARLKTIKHQTEFVDNAPCVTTPKKYTEYFLKHGAKHADQFFNVGYTAENPLQLRYDMARQFDIGKAVDYKLRDDGKEAFNIYMELGTTKKRTFITGWIKDTPDSAPRIVTAFRKDK